MRCWRPTRRREPPRRRGVPSGCGAPGHEAILRSTRGSARGEITTSVGAPTALSRSGVALSLGRVCEQAFVRCAEQSFNKRERPIGCRHRVFAALVRQEQPDQEDDHPEDHGDCSRNGSREDLQSCSGPGWHLRKERVHLFVPLVEAATDCCAGSQPATAEPRYGHFALGGSRLQDLLLGILSAPFQSNLRRPRGTGNRTCCRPHPAAA